MPRKRLPEPKFDRMIDVESDVIAAVQYDPDLWVLDVFMKNGSTYRYRGIATSSFAKLVTSASPGKIYNDFIKRNPWDGSERKCTKLRGIRPRAPFVCSASRAVRMLRSRAK